MVGRIPAYKWELTREQVRICVASSFICVKILFPNREMKKRFGAKRREEEILKEIDSVRAIYEKINDIELFYLKTKYPYVSFI